MLGDREKVALWIGERQYVRHPSGGWVFCVGNRRDNVYFDVKTKESRDLLDALVKKREGQR